ncbi:N-6 DNA methylase [Bremerella cremea]|uniref:site-specific DNA-methyltransferase (adenine-specific) n=1 Tax=Bremerella cremea TaxID=1031537 RepID=A0A368KKE8_9BACT|nr:N-6 DNA methylase [Bremerella cremea]RCS41248.1 N-6 DNA methylase [Bremerella cremea]
MASPQEFLDSVYEQLDLNNGELLNAVSTPFDEVSSENWVEKGEWLSLAHSVGVEKIFFVQNNPVLVFATANAVAQDDIRTVVNRIWCMSRPQCLFLACPGELLVFDLTRPPIRTTEQLEAQGRLLRRVVSIAKVQEELAAYRRELLESGTAIEGQGYFSPGEARADKSLLRDLKLVRNALLDAGLDGPNAVHANSLIGRSIFIRYLEDRRILLESDFEAVASRRKRWRELLASNQGVPIEPSMQHIRYTKLLSDKDFTYAFFRQISEDFNGDLFPVTEEEEEAVTEDHLKVLQRFLRAEIADPTRPLFFFAYQFEVIPIELISSIYEEFYNTERGVDRNHGTHYTPIELVEFVLSSCLTTDVLKKNPTILDPACGSGIFLVEAFRRVVRYRQVKQKRRLGLPELRKIIRDQLRGIDINGEAIRVAAFSLYLALLHHLDPPDIWREKRLPHLTHDPVVSTKNTNRFDILFEGNAFAVGGEQDSAAAKERIQAGTIDVIVGNPPWGYPKKNDQLGRKAARVAIDWCNENECAVGDQELSQAFIHRAMNLLRPGGAAALLVSTGVFFKHHPNSKTFRQQWLKNGRIDRVVNFSAVRHLYFNSGIAPFVSVVFTKDAPGVDHVIEYWSAKATLQAKQMRAVVLSLADRKLLPQLQALADDRVWKVYWWGSHHDYALICGLESCDSLESIVGSESFGQGFKKANQEHDSDWLKEFDEFPLASFERYGPLPKDEFCPVPSHVERRGVREVYSGWRLLVKRGIVQAKSCDGRIESRLERESFAFTNSIHGVLTGKLEKWQQYSILAIFWSSVARYYYWMTSGSWGMWHHEIHLDDVKRMPISFPKNDEVRNRLIEVVERLRSTYAHGDELISLRPKEESIHWRERAFLEKELDSLVFECYSLSDMHRDLINDMCSLGLNLFYRNASSEAVKPLIIPESFCLGRCADLSPDKNRNDILPYVKTLCEHWNQELGDSGEFAWHVIQAPAPSPMIAVLLEAIGPQSEITQSQWSMDWAAVLEWLSENSTQPMGSRRVYVDGIVRAVGESEVLLIKRNERRLWTASAAREDAEATIRQAMLLQEMN